MNELIEKLSKEANAWYPMGYPSGEGGDAAWQNLVIFEREDLEKFAELIVQECIQSIENTIQTNCETDSEKMGCEFAISDLIQHFGVE
jgi:hypothetical protein